MSDKTDERLLIEILHSTFDRLMDGEAERVPTDDNPVQAFTCMMYGVNVSTATRRFRISVQEVHR
jgi:hypothetical protein